jgi:serine/threonine-protein kinase
MTGVRGQPGAGRQGLQGQEDGVTSTSGGSLVGKQLGDFQLQGLLGAGGMAEVYRGFDVKLKRQVAVKILPAAMANDPGYVQRFKTEAQRVAALNNPHIVPVYHFGEEGQLLYHVMPILKESLRDRLDREITLTPQDAVRLVVQIASALSVAHVAGLVHRDVKPENILLDDKGEAYLTDFGIARPVTPTRVGRAAQTLSATGLPVGTPEYMAPEQLRGEPMDQRADIYALGAVLYELLTGHAPHEADTPYEVAALSLMGKIDPPSTLVPGIPEELEDVIMIALAPDPAARYPDASSFAFAARRAVFPRGRSLLTGLPGLRRATRENVILSRPRRTERADEPTHPLGPRATRAIWAMTGGGKGRTGRPQLTTRTLLITVAATALVVVLCGAAGLSLARQMQLPVLGFAPTATIRPTVTPLPTATPSPTPQPTATTPPPPVLRLSVPAFTWTRATNCTGTTKISNPNPSGGAAMTWRWQSMNPSPFGFRWALNVPATASGLPIETNKLAPGASETLNILFRCPSEGQTYAVIMLDSYSRVYNITLAPQ